MITIKFYTAKMNKGHFFIFPTVIIDSSEKVEKARIEIGFVWLRGLFAIGIEWGQKRKN